LRKPIILVVAIVLGIVSGFAAFHYAARKARASHSVGNDAGDFDPGF
jgi:hypothetical protein